MRPFARSRILLRGTAATLDLDRISRADALTDLASARYERGIREQRPRDLAEAFSAAARAVEIAPDSVEARFVYAMSLDALHLRDDAIDAWKAYLKLDAASGWAGEARQHLRSLEQVVAASPQRTRVLAEEELLGEWGDALRAGDRDRARSALSRAEAIANTLAARGGDTMTSAACKRIATAPAADLLLLSEAHASYASARKLWAKARDARARDAIQTSAQLLERTQSPLSPRAWIYAGTIQHYLGDSANARATIDHALDLLRGHEDQYPLAAGQALWTRGLIDHAQGLPDRALQTYAEARVRLTRAGEPSALAGIETVLADASRYVGDDESAWMHGLVALRWLDSDAPYTRTQTALNDVALTSLATGQTRLAELLARRIIRNAEVERESLYGALGRLTYSRILIARGRAAEARRFLDEAASLAATVPQQSSALRLVADIAIARGEILSTADPRSAVQLLTSALDQLRDLDDDTRLARLHLLASAAHRALGDSRSEKRELLAGIEEIEKQRGQLVDDQERSTFTDTARALYDGTIRLLVVVGATSDALRVVRRARTIGTSSSESLPDGTAQIEYYVLPESLLTWVTIDRRTRFTKNAMTSTALATLVERHSRAILDCKHASDCVDNSSALFALLIEPVSDEIAHANALLIAPDAVLHRVPFSALYDRAARQFLVQQRSVTIMLGTEAARETRGYRSILVAAAPSAPGDLPRLESADREAAYAASTFAHAKTLSARHATADQFLASADGYDVVHFAGHAVWNEREPGRAALRFAADEKRPTGELYAYELSRTPLEHTRLVVLAACDSARGRLTGAGLLGFARSFIAAGVPQAIGSLWPVDDAASREFFFDFYDALRRGETPSSALRAAQCAAITTSNFDGPAYWGTYQIYTGNSRKVEKRS